MTPNLRIEIFPTDLTATIEFYTKVLGFTLVRHEPNLIQDTASPDRQTRATDKGYAHMVNGSIHIGADGSHPADSLAVEREFRRPPTAVELVVEVNDLEAVRAQVENQGWSIRSDEDIRKQPWGLRDFRIEDPDGYYIRVSEISVKGDGTGW